MISSSAPRTDDLGSLRPTLERTLAAGRISPAYLLEGPDGLTLRRAAQALAAALLCPTERLGCECASCIRVRAGTHPDLVRLTRDRPTVISVAALEPVLAQAHRRPGHGARQVFVIEPAEALEPEGVARYLKTLEEPPPSTVFLLLTTRPERLPDTVRSRCRRLGFAPLTEPEIAARLVGAGHDAASAARLARVASGSLERALRLADADVPARVAEAWEAARSSTPGAARAVEGLLAALEVAAAGRAAALDAAEPLEGRGTDRKREALRSVLQDLLHVVAVEARDAAAGRPCFGGVALAPRSGLDLLERTGRLSAAVAANVTPSVVLHDLLRALGAGATP